MHRRHGGFRLADVDASAKPKPMILDWHLEFDPDPATWKSDAAYRFVRRAKAGNIDPLELARALVTVLEQHGFQRSQITPST